MSTEDYLDHVDHQLLGIVQHDIAERAQQLVMIRLRRDWTAGKEDIAKLDKAIDQRMPALIKLFTESHKIMARLESRLYQRWQNHIPSRGMILACRDDRIDSIMRKEGQTFEQRRAACQRNWDQRKRAAKLS